MPERGNNVPAAPRAPRQAYQPAASIAALMSRASHQVVCDGEAGRGRARGHVELAIDRFQVLLNRARADDERFRDLLVVRPWATRRSPSTSHVVKPAGYRAAKGCCTMGRCGGRGHPAGGLASRSQFRHGAKAAAIACSSGIARPSAHAAVNTGSSL